MRALFVCLLCLMLCSCSSKQYIYYKYNGVTVTRVDSGDVESRFYYGYYNKKSQLPQVYVIGKYPWGTDIMSGEIVFNKDKSVTVIYGENLSQVGTDSLFKFVNYTDSNILQSIKWEKQIEGHYNNVVSVADNIDLEKRQNKANHSKVEAIYPK